jgi:hypothetical protein
VLPDFRSDDLDTDAAIVEEARRLSYDLQESSQPTEASPAAAAEIQAAFAEWVLYIATLDSQYERALQVIRALEQSNASESKVTEFDRSPERAKH